LGVSVEVFPNQMKNFNLICCGAHHLLTKEKTQQKFI